MFMKFMSFRVKDHAVKVKRRKYKRYQRLKARNFDRFPTKKQWKNYFKYMR